MSFAPSEARSGPPALTSMDLVENCNYYKDLHVGMQSGETAQTLDQTKQHSEVQPIAPPAQVMPTLTRVAQLRCDPSETHPKPPAPTFMDLVENCNYYKDLHVGMQVVKQPKT